MTAPAKSAARARDVRAIALAAVLALLAVMSVRSLVSSSLQQPFATDFSPIWAGARIAIRHPERLYDFAYVTAQQAPAMARIPLRVFVYPPSALPFMAPFGIPSFWLGYGLWLAVTGGLFVAAALRAGAKWWIVLFPPLAYVAACGQVTFLVGGLVVAGLALRDRRIVAGVLFGIAGAVKPQLLALLPVALIADRQWRTIVATGATAGFLATVTAAIWGVGAWTEWLAAALRFQKATFLDAYLTRDTVTPYAALVRSGIDGAWAYLLIPPVAAAVWFVFRRTTRVAERSLALFGGTLLIIPYAMSYELTLLAPAVAVFLARTEDRRWPACLAAAPIFGFGSVFTFGTGAVVCLPTLIAVLALLGWAAVPDLARAKA